MSVLEGNVEMREDFGLQKGVRVGLSGGMG